MRLSPLLAYSLAKACPIPEEAPVMSVYNINCFSFLIRCLDIEYYKCLDIYCQEKSLRNIIYSFSSVQIFLFLWIEKKLGLTP